MQILKKFQNYHFVDVNKLPQPAETSAFFLFLFRKHHLTASFIIANTFQRTNPLQF